MSDTTTTLNPGSGGDVMDEELVTQDNDSTAKAPRVLIRGKGKGAVVDAFNAEPTTSPYSTPSLAIGVVDDSPPGNFVRGELRPVSLTNEGRVRVSTVPASLEPDYFGDEQVSWFGSEIYSKNPWKDIL